jgi:hypothetical protein
VELGSASLNGDEIAAMKRATVEDPGSVDKVTGTEESGSSSEEESESSLSEPPRILSLVTILEKGATFDSRMVLNGDRIRLEAVK